MKLLTNITLTVCVLSVVSTVLMMLVPDRFRGELRSVISLVAVVTIGAALFGADLSDLSARLSDISFDSGQYSNDLLIQSELEERVGEYIYSFLREEGIECKKVSVRTTIDEQRRIFITEASLMLDSVFAVREDEVKALITQKTGEIDVKISYEES